MAVIAVADVSLSTLLRLARVSNIPTVWTNVLAGTVLAGAMEPGWRIGVVLLAASLYYSGGMFLNDYFDRTIDASERPERPIPAGEISATTVAKIGFGLLFAGSLMLLPAGALAVAIGLLLSSTIVGYDLHHKNNAAAPIVMGGCRALVYCMAAAAGAGGVSTIVVIAAVALLAYVAGRSFAAHLFHLFHRGAPSSPGDFLIERLRRPRSAKWVLRLSGHNSCRCVHRQSGAVSLLSPCVDRNHLLVGTDVKSRRCRPDGIRNEGWG
jgi:hypothetical protein